jgi:hypothetical protein
LGDTSFVHGKTFDANGCCAIVLWLLKDESLPSSKSSVADLRLVCTKFCNALQTLVHRGCKQEDDLKCSIPKDVPIRLKMCVLGGIMFFNCCKGLFTFNLSELPTLIPSSERFAELAREKLQLDRQIYGKMLEGDR